MAVHVVHDGFLACLELFEKLVLAFLIPVYDIVVELYEGHQTSVALEDHGFVYTLHIVDDAFYFLRIYVFPRRSENHVAEPSLYVIAALFVHGGKVVCPEPSVIGEYGTGP